MSEYFIVLATAPNQHETLADALTEQRMLQAHFPEKTFTVRRCKMWLTGAKHFTKAVELLRDILSEGLTDANKGRLRILLQTISTRTPRLKTLIQVNGPPEFESAKRSVKMPSQTMEVRANET